MKRYFIKKEIVAKSAIDALKKEKSGEIVEIWMEDQKSNNQLSPAIGFDAYIEEYD